MMRAAIIQQKKENQQLAKPLLGKGVRQAS